MATKTKNEVTQNGPTQTGSVQPDSAVVSSTAKKKAETFDISNPEETMHLANDLARFINENKLFHNIQGKEYVNVEGWQYAGSRLGILPIVEELTSIGEDIEIKYQAKVKLFDLRTSQIVGTGFAICSNKEATKRYYQEFAIASMAQTRAIGKAYRNILAWIIRAAGYEPTPAEEMDYAGALPDRAAPTVKVTHATEAEVAHREDTPEQSIKPLREPKATISENRPVAEDKKLGYPRPEPEDAGQDANPITIQQKTQILLLLNNSAITKEEKEKMVVKINTFDTIRAEKAVEKLKKVIQERTTPSENGMAA